MLSNALKSNSPRIIQHLGYEHEITYFFRFVISYVIDNEEEAEFIYHKERVKYEKSVLLSQLLTNNKKNWSNLTLFQIVTGEGL